MHFSFDMYVEFLDTVTIYPPILWVKVTGMKLNIQWPCRD